MRNKDHIFNEVGICEILSINLQSRIGGYDSGSASLKHKLFHVISIIGNLYSRLIDYNFAEPHVKTKEDHKNILLNKSKHNYFI